tara:strand:- start:7941 stop:8132 length:192 start_codon:yes stop_codon:yes gene_type:complete
MNNEETIEDQINKIKQEIKERERVHKQELEENSRNYAEADYDDDLNKLNVKLEELLAKKRKNK